MFASIRCTLPPGSWITGARRDSRPSRRAPHAAKPGQISPRRNRAREPEPDSEYRGKFFPPLCLGRRSRPATSLPPPPQWRDELREMRRNPRSPGFSEFPPAVPPCLAPATSTMIASSSPFLSFENPPSRHPTLTSAGAVAVVISSFFTLWQAIRSQYGPTLANLPRGSKASGDESIRGGPWISPCSFRLRSRVSEERNDESRHPVLFPEKKDKCRGPRHLPPRFVGNRSA